MNIIREIDLVLRNYSAIMGFSSIIISGLTLVLAFRISKQFGAAHIKTKQIDHVCSLIEYLNNTKAEIDFSTNSGNGSYSGTGVGVVFNIFEIGRYDDIEAGGLNKEYDDSIVLFENKSNQLIDVKIFIDHPLTPRILADELLIFYNYFSYNIDLAKEGIAYEKFVVLTTGVKEEKIASRVQKEGILIQGNADAFKSWLSLKEYSKNLKIAIGNWLIENGITENNIRQDFKNR